MLLVTAVADAIRVGVGRGGITVRMLSSQSREPGFESSWRCFETLVILFNSCCHSSLSCINEYLVRWISE